MIKHLMIRPQTIKPLTIGPPSMGGCPPHPPLMYRYQGPMREFWPIRAPYAYVMLSCTFF